MKLHLGKNHTRQNHGSAERTNQAHPNYPVLGHGQDQDGPRQIPLTLAEATEQARTHDQYIVPMHIVFVHRLNAQSLAEPTQIPWLEEIRNDRYLAQAASEVI